MEPCQSIIKWSHVVKENPIGMFFFLSHINYSPALKVYLYGKMQYCAEAVTETSTVPLGGQSTWVIVRAYLCTQGQDGMLHAYCVLGEPVWLWLRTFSKVSAEGRQWGWTSILTTGHHRLGKITFFSHWSERNFKKKLPIFICARCPLSCGWAPLRRVWPHPFDTHPADIYRHF